GLRGRRALVVAVDGCRDRLPHQRLERSFSVGDAQRFEHGAARLFGRSDVTVRESCHDLDQPSVSATYASRSSSASAPPSAIETLISQPASNGSAFTREGSSTTASLTSRTRPTTGA